MFSKCVCKQVCQPPPGEVSVYTTDISLLWSACCVVFHFSLSLKLLSFWLLKPYIIFLSMSYQLPVSFAVWAETLYLPFTTPLYCSLPAPSCLCHISAMELLNCTRMRVQLSRKHPMKSMLKAKTKKHRGRFLSMGTIWTATCRVHGSGLGKASPVSLHNGGEQPLLAVSCFPSTASWNWALAAQFCFQAQSIPLMWQVLLTFLLLPERQAGLQDWPKAGPRCA